MAFRIIIILSLAYPHRMSLHHAPVLPPISILKRTNEYHPPCWVNPSLQRRLSHPPKNSASVYKIGREFWEASGGLLPGFVEFEKYVNTGSPGVSAHQIRNMWASYFPPDMVCGSFPVLPPPTVSAPKSPLSPLAPVFSISSKSQVARPTCYHCGEKFIPGARKNVCSACVDAATIVAKVVDFVFE